MEVTMQAGKRAMLHLAPRAQRGFTFLAVLAAMLILALGTQGVMHYVSTQAQREREQDLLRVGQAYMQAIGAYYELTPGRIKQWPRSLEELLEDRRLVTIKRHLRETYPDPITRSHNWGLVTASDGGITGVYSRSEAKPLRTAAIEIGNLTIPPAGRYADWQFVYTPAPAGSASTR